MNENLLKAFEMMGQGLLGIFVVLGLIALIVVAMQKFNKKK